MFPPFLVVSQLYLFISIRSNIGAKRDGVDRNSRSAVTRQLTRGTTLWLMCNVLRSQRRCKSINKSNTFNIQIKEYSTNKNVFL